MHQQFSARTPVCDHAMTVLYWADRTRASELLKTPGIAIVRSRHRIKALQYLGPDPSALSTGSRHKRGCGVPHRNENYWNVKGVWHIDRIPEPYRPHFRQVLSDCFVAGNNQQAHCIATSNTSFNEAGHG